MGGAGGWGHRVAFCRSPAEEIHRGQGGERLHRGVHQEPHRLPGGLPGAPWGPGKWGWAPLESQGDGSPPAWESLALFKCELQNFLFKRKLKEHLYKLLLRPNPPTLWTGRLRSKEEKPRSQPRSLRTGQAPCLLVSLSATAASQSSHTRPFPVTPVTPIRAEPCRGPLPLAGSLTLLCRPLSRPSFPAGAPARRTFSP